MIEFFLMPLLPVWGFCLGFWVRDRKPDYGSKQIAKLVLFLRRNEKFLPPEAQLTASVQLLVRGEKYKLSLVRNAETAHD